ncbi:hypothetical protein QOZ80_3AG0220380 [Eleusine coracana subsp. coracana]|nr:hypothetical protein QOZ80_3AG0220380 [Eleusine coracana subsp. coracana]
MPVRALLCAEAQTAWRGGSSSLSTSLAAIPTAAAPLDSVKRQGGDGRRRALPLLLRLRRRREDATDDDDDATEDERVVDGGRIRGKRKPLMRDASPSSPKKNSKARLGVIIALPSEAPTPTSSPDRTASSSSSPRGGVRVRESSSDSEETHQEARPDPRKRNGNNNKNIIKTKNKPLGGACGKRKRTSPGCDEEVDQEPRRDVTITAAAATSVVGRFPCNQCDRCFYSPQALGGHVLGHQKKARIAAAPSLGGAGGHGNCNKAEVAAVELDHDRVNNGVGYAERKTSVGAPCAYGSRCHEKKATPYNDDDAACHHEDHVYRGRRRKLKKKPSITAEDRMGAYNGNGSIDSMGTSMFAAIHEGVNDHDRNREEASSRNEEMTIGAGRSHNDGDVKNKKGARKDDGAAIGNSNVEACRTQLYRCKFCGTECPTGQALGGHMRKHRKLPAQVAHGDERPAPATTDGDSRIHVSRQFGATGLHTALMIAGEASS